jgi:ribosome-associated protein
MLREVGMKPIGREGEAELKWVLLDYGDFVVHVFQPQEREFYRLERLWGEADRLVLPPEIANVTMAPAAPEADPADAE